MNGLFIAIFPELRDLDVVSTFIMRFSTAINLPDCLVGESSTLIFKSSLLFQSLVYLKHLTMTATYSSRATSISTALLFRLNDTKTRKFWGMLATIAIIFLIYTAVLFNLPMLWKYRALSPLREQSAINNLTSATIPTLDYRALKQRYFDFTRPIAVDVWFALAFMPALDAITVVGSCNRPIIDHWHYFVSVRMMALASLASFTILLSGNSTSYVSQYSGMVCIFAFITYGLIGLCLDQFRAPPPKRSTNLRNWSLSEYANALSRSRGTWRAAMASTSVTCGLGTVLTALIPSDWSTIIPVITTGFEVAFSLSTFFKPDSPRNSESVY